MHGEKSQMMRLKSKLLSLNADKSRPVKIYSPANGEELRIPFKADKLAKVVGRLAQISPPLAVRSKKDLNGSRSSANGKTKGVSNDDEEDNEESSGSDVDNNIDHGKTDDDDGKNKPSEPQVISGVLVQNDFKMSLMAPEDLREYAGLTTTTITCKQRITLAAAGFDLVRWSLEGIFGAVRIVHGGERKDSNGKGSSKSDGGVVKSEIGNEVKKEEDVDGDEYNIDEVGGIDDQVREIVVMDSVSVRWRPRGEVEVVWEGNYINDGIADAVMAALVMLEGSPAAVKCEFAYYLSIASLLSSV